MEETAITFKVLLQPRASREGIDGLHGDAVKVRVFAPPLEGKANKALKRFIAKKLNISSSQVEIIAGQRSRQKLLRITGISRAEIEKTLGIALPSV
ncbi:MAG: YggU family protein [Deltaproteobacteria bacterium RBG_13_52_11]|nr:MAG: YggU family protein [Deltaproteobacteria bacterium RBG_13_52_11]